MGMKNDFSIAPNYIKCKGINKSRSYAPKEIRYEDRNKHIYS